MPAPDVLTDVPGKPGRFWGDHTTFVGPEQAARLAVEAARRRRRPTT